MAAQSKENTGHVFPVPLDVRGKEHLETFAFFFFLWALLSERCLDLGHQSFDAQTVSVRLSLRVVEGSFWLWAALLVRHRQPDSSCCFLQATNQTSRFSPVGSRAGHWDRRPQIHPLSLGLRHVIPVHNRLDWYCRPKISLRDDCSSLTMSLGFSAGSATTVGHSCARCPNQTDELRMFFRHK